MTTVYLHGILKKEYQDYFKLNLNYPSDVVRAIDCNRRGFKGRLNELSLQGFNYAILINKKLIKSSEELNSFGSCERIDLVPMIIGSGGFIAGLLGLTGAAATITAAVINVGIAFVLTPKPDLGLPAEQDISATSNADKESYIFSSNVNLAQQGSFLPIGYGRLKIGSSVIQSSIKSFPVIKPDSEALQSDNFINKVTNRDESFSANSFNN